MDGSVTHVGGLRLPAALMLAIQEGRWKPPPDEQVLIDVFHDQPAQPMFYDFVDLPLQNESFQQWSPLDAVRNLGMRSPGIGVESALAGIIGDLGTDSPIVLDYRLNRSSPRVIFGRGDGWHLVAADFENLERMLGL